MELDDEFVAAFRLPIPVLAMDPMVNLIKIVYGEDLRLIGRDGWILVVQA